MDQTPNGSSDSAEVPGWLEEAAHDELVQDAHVRMAAAESAGLAAERAREEAERQRGSGA